MAMPQNRSNGERWKNIKITQEDLQDLLTYLFEIETPLTIDSLAQILVKKSFRTRKAEVEAKQKKLGKTLHPKNHYSVSERVTFPQLDWKSGVVNAVRPGVNPEFGTFNVISVDLGIMRFVNLPPI